MNERACDFSTVSPRRAGALSKIEQLRMQGQLPSPKGAALALMELSRREDVGVDAIAEVVQTDPALTSRILRVANSAAVGHGRPVVSIPEAVMRLGLATVRHVAMGFSLVDQYQNGACKSFDYMRFWSHSLLMGLAMQSLGKLSRVGSPDELFACGLMARIGCLALATIHPNEYSELLDRQVSDDQLATLERQQLRADHNDFTVAILCDCGIPKSLAEPVYYHEDPDQSGFAEGSRPYQLVHVFYHAKRLADMGLASEVERSSIISELMLLGGKLGMDADEMGGLVDRTVSQWQEWGELLKVHSSQLPPFAEMAAANAPRKVEQQDSSPAMRVLLVEDEPTTRIMMEVALASIEGSQVYTAENGREALTLALEVMPQIVITDWLMPVMDGLELCRALRATSWGQSMYVIMLTGVESEHEVVQAFEAGVDDYVTKPVDVRALRARMRAALHYVQLLDAWERDRAQLKQFAAELAISNRKLEHYALTDLLTGLPNRRAGLDFLGQTWSAANRSGQGVSVMMIDIDHFKRVNDTHGHAVGDKVLTEVGRLLRATARKDDHVCRMGGEEFLVICQNSSPASTLQAAERLRRRVGDAPIVTGNVAVKTSISVGVACKEASLPDVDSVLVAADKALYAAKQAGRNRSCL
ncbi:MAG: diguanylate cyclase, partial [Thiotrichales bacterium]